MKDLAINKGEVKEIEEVRKMLEEEKEKVIAQKQEELDQVRSEMAQVKGELLRVVTELETTKADSIKEFTNQEENVKKLTAELDQLRVCLSCCHFLSLSVCFCLSVSVSLSLSPVSSPTEGLSFFLSYSYMSRVLAFYFLQQGESSALL